MQQIRFQPLDRKRQGYLFPKEVGRTGKLDNAQVAFRKEATVGTGGYNDMIFVSVVPLLQMTEQFQCYEIHAVLVEAEKSLGFYGYFHTFSICWKERRMMGSFDGPDIGRS